MKKLLVAILLILSIASCEHQKHDKVIALQPYINFDKSLLDTISKTMEGIYNKRVVILPSGKLPQEAFIKIKFPRYRADKLISILSKNKPDSIDYILGLTTQDISTTKKNADGSVKEPASKYSDWGVFGLGYMPGSSCVVSTYRIKNPDSKMMERLKKICIHELGHNMGLPHCDSEFCVMADAAETVKTVDQVHLGLCASCKKKLE